MEYSKSKVENNVKSIFFFQNILSKNVAKNCLPGLYSIYHLNALCTYRNVVHECTTLHDNVMQILSPMEPWVLLLVHICVCLMCCLILIPKYSSTWNIFLMSIVLNNSVPIIKKSNSISFLRISLIKLHRPLFAIVIFNFFYGEGCSLVFL